MSEQQELKSKLFSSLFEGVDASRPLIVLDIGVAVPKTVEFFSNYRCRLHFADLFSAAIVQHQKNNSSSTVLEAQFKQLLDFPDGTKFDICLFWDFLNYLDVPAFQAFNKKLSQYVDVNTRGHAFGVLNKQTSLTPRQYGISQSDTLIVSELKASPLTSYPQSQSDVKALLSCFEVNKRLLLSDGRLEMLLTGQKA